MKMRWLLVFVPVLFSLRASAEYFVIKQYDLIVTFTEEGYADFEEVIEVEFSQPRHGILRAIPYRDRINGKMYDRLIRNEAVLDHPFTKYKENTNLVLKIGDANIYVDGKQVYRIRYRILNPLNFFDETTEFYWDLLGTAWTTDVENFSFRLIFPHKVNLTDADVFGVTGAAGARETNVGGLVNGNEVSGHTTKRFAPGEGLTVGVRVQPKDAFEPMSEWSSLFARHGLLLAPIIFLVAGIMARFFARNKRQTIMTEYFPPEGISPAVAGGFVDHSVDNSDVLSLLPHLANHGYLRMEAVENKGFFKKDKIIFHKLKEAGPDLMTFEAYFFNALFAGGSRVELDSLKDKFYSHMSSIQASVKEWIKQQGWYESDQKAMGCFTALAGLIAMAWGAYAIFGRQNMDGIALIVTGFILFYFSSRFNKRSPEGNKTYQKLEGFRQFVAKAERPVIERLLKDDPLYYDKTMPFALAFGYLKQWNKQFDGLLTQPPSWYSGPMMYGHGMHQSWSTFSESFPSEISNIGSVFSSTPSSGGSGGGGGGGFSGGGSGGGGGSSW